jgi:hypothetical protein
MHLRLPYTTVRGLLLRQTEARTTADDCWHDATLTYPQSRMAINSWYSPELQAPANRTLFRIGSYAEIYLNNGELRDSKLHESVVSYGVTIYNAYSLLNNMIHDNIFHFLKLDGN